MIRFDRVAVWEWFQRFTEKKGASSMAHWNHSQGWDFDDYDSIPTGTLPTGVYPVRLESVTQGRSRQKQTPEVDFCFCVREGEWAETLIFHRRYWTEKTKGRVKAFCERLGIDPRKPLKENPFEVWCDVMTRIQEGYGGTEWVEAVKFENVRQVERSRSEDGLDEFDA